MHKNPEKHVQGLHENRAFINNFFINDKERQERHLQAQGMEATEKSWSNVRSYVIKLNKKEKELKKFNRSGTNCCWR